MDKDKSYVEPYSWYSFDQLLQCLRFHGRVITTFQSHKQVINCNRKTSAKNVL